MTEPLKLWTSGDIARELGVRKQLVYDWVVKDRPILPTPYALTQAAGHRGHGLWTQEQVDQVKETYRARKGKPQDPTEGLWKTSDIARELGISAKVTSNWPQRWADFPAPAYQKGPVRYYTGEDARWVMERYRERKAVEAEAKAAKAERRIAKVLLPVTRELTDQELMEMEDRERADRALQFLLNR